MNGGAQPSNSSSPLAISLNPITTFKVQSNLPTNQAISCKWIIYTNRWYKLHRPQLSMIKRLWHHFVNGHALTTYGHSGRENHCCKWCYIQWCYESPHSTIGHGCIVLWFKLNLVSHYRKSHCWHHQALMNWAITSWDNVLSFIRHKAWIT